MQARNTIDGDLVVARRRTHGAQRCAAPNADGIRRDRGRLRIHAAREQAQGGEDEDAHSTIHESILLVRDSRGSSSHNTMKTPSRETATVAATPRVPTITRATR